MTTHNPGNERIKRQYLIHLKEARQQSEATVDAVADALARFEAATRCRDFKAFHFEQAVAFKNRLAQHRNMRSGAPLSKATLYATVTHLKRFFQWLAMQPGYKGVKYSDAEYFNLSDNDTRIAMAKRERAFPTIEQVRHVLRRMPTVSEIERRNRALIAFALLTGARDSAIASMKLKHLDLSARTVHQDAREVRTKFRKTFVTVFFPVGDDVRQIVEQWVAYLLGVKLWGNDDPLFPATETIVGPDQKFVVIGVKREHWKTASRIRTIFRDAFHSAGLPYFNPHSFRKTLVALGRSLCRTPEELKAWSQNLGHDSVLTTLSSYGAVQVQRQAEIMSDLGGPRNVGLSRETIEEIIKRLQTPAGVSIE